MSLYSISVPETLYQKLKKQADSQKKSLDDLVQQALARQLPPAVPVEDDLPTLLRDELLAMEHLSDASLWQIARSTMETSQIEQMDQFGELQHERAVTIKEQQEIDALLLEYDETVLRRAHAAMLLSGRGFDMSDPSLLAKK